jgi:hypothetical protein
MVCARRALHLDLSRLRPQTITDALQLPGSPCAGLKFDGKPDGNNNVPQETKICLVFVEYYTYAGCLSCWPEPRAQQSKLRKGTLF